MRKLGVGLGLLLLGVLFVGWWLSRPPSSDLIFYGGPILTVNQQDEVVEALAVRDGVIVALGDTASVMTQRSANTRLIDLQGRALLPGFVAAHEHPTLTAVFAGAHDLSGFTHQSNAQVWSALRQAVADTPAGEWVYAGGLDALLVPDLKVPMREALDALAPDNPVLLISQTLHSAWANSMAFAEAGVTADTPDPGSGSFYERDEQGDFTGFIAETRAMAPFVAGLRAPLGLVGRYGETLDGYLSQGFTSVASLGYNLPPWMARLVALRDFRPRIRQFFYLVDSELQYLPDAPEQDDPYFRVLGVKLWHDGSPYTGSMLSSTPYLDSELGKMLGIEPGSHGAAMIGQDELVERLRRYSAAGWQVAIHSQGDESNRQVARALLAALPTEAASRQVRLEHSVLLPEDLLPELAKRGVSPSFHINHILYYGDRLADSIIGRHVAQQVLPVRRAFELQMHPSLHADSPMFPTEGYSLMQTAVTRQTSSGQTLNAAQAIDVRQALRAMTINAAWQLGIDQQAGSLEVGKWADLQIVDHSPYTVEAQRLHALQVQEVYVAGIRQFSRH
ncbi:amidohydrolase [Halopseudomonas pachastrellae]|uniref:amidohydrolase n=1 Tax=Halopseudomonas pachastrellae TaxID=254161 RepID=UPI003D7ED180